MVFLKIHLCASLLFVLLLGLYGCTELSEQPVFESEVNSASELISSSSNAAPLPPQAPGVPQKLGDLEVPSGIDSGSLSTLYRESVIEAARKDSASKLTLVLAWRQQGVSNDEINKRLQELKATFLAQYRADKFRILAEKFEAWKQENQK